MLRRIAVAGLLAVAATTGFAVLATAATEPPPLPCIGGGTDCTKHPAPIETTPLSSFPGDPWEWDPKPAL